MELVVTIKICINENEGDGMNQEQINEAYKNFNIPEGIIPNYTNAEEFSKNFEKCSVLKNVDVCYASNTIPIDLSQNKQNTVR